MTIYAAHVVDTPGDPFAGDPAAALAEDGALLVRDGVIRARGSLAELRAAHPGEPVTRLDGGLLLPGFVDTHVQFPQIRAIGGLGLPLLDWLEQCALPEESKLADRAYARAVAWEFLDGLLASGTTSALVFGSHFAPAMDELFTAAERRGLNITSGLVLSDRILRPDLLNSPETALADSADLILRWHDRGRLRYAVTPRFSLSASDEMLDAGAQHLVRGGEREPRRDRVPEPAAVMPAQDQVGAVRQRGLRCVQQVGAQDPVGQDQAGGDVQAPP